MPLEDVHVQEMDRATSRMEVTRINPTRSYMEVKLDPVTGKWAGSPGLITWQNGSWYDTGGNTLAPETIPEVYRNDIQNNPVTVTTHGPAVTWSCPFCSEKMNQSEQEAHLMAHVNETMKAAGKIADPKGEREVAAKNTHVPGR